MVSELDLVMFLGKDYLQSNRTLVLRPLALLTSTLALRSRPLGNLYETRAKKKDAFIKKGRKTSI